MSSGNSIHVQHLGQVAYEPTFEAMKAFTASRSTKNADLEGKKDLQANEYGRDQLLICEHPRVFTQGLAGKVEHVLNPGNIPVVKPTGAGRSPTTGPGRWWRIR